MIRKDLDAVGLGEVIYEAGFWEAPISPGSRGRYVRHRCDDRVMWRWKDKKIVGRCLLNTSPSVSYYSKLAKDLGLDKPIPKSAKLRR